MAHSKTRLKNKTKHRPIKLENLQGRGDLLTLTDWLKETIEKPLKFSYELLGKIFLFFLFLKVIKTKDRLKPGKLHEANVKFTTL